MLRWECSSTMLGRADRTRSAPCRVESDVLGQETHTWVMCLTNLMLSQARISAPLQTHFCFRVCISVEFQESRQSAYGVPFRFLGILAETNLRVSNPWSAVLRCVEICGTVCFVHAHGGWRRLDFHAAARTGRDLITPFSDLLRFRKSDRIRNNEVRLPERVPKDRILN